MQAPFSVITRLGLMTPLGASCYRSCFRDEETKSTQLEFELRELECRAVASLFKKACVHKGRAGLNICHLCFVCTGMLESCWRKAIPSRSVEGKRLCEFLGRKGMTLWHREQAIEGLILPCAFHSFPAIPLFMKRAVPADLWTGTRKHEICR